MKVESSGSRLYKLSTFKLYELISLELTSGVTSVKMVITLISISNGEVYS